MKTVTINVTRQMIREARKDDRTRKLRMDYCPLARGLHAAGYPKANVLPASFSLDGTALTAYPLPRRAKAFAADFDAGKPVKPARFRLTIKD